jgi:hypothetical protein
MIDQLRPHAESAPPGKKVFIFASMHSWIRHTAVTGLVLRGLGHDVTLGYLPYGEYDKPINRFDLRLQDLYARNILGGMLPLIKIVPFMRLRMEKQLPPSLSESVERVTICDVQYILQREDVSGEEPVYFLRRSRNTRAARLALAYFQKNRPDVVIIPNGMIQEYGAVYETARFLDIPTVTYEFCDLDQHVLLDRNRLVIFHLTDELWAGIQDRVLNDEERAWLESFLAERQGLMKGTQFAHVFQKTTRTGGEKVRSLLGLNERPVILLPTNVLGDSATLRRTLFSRSMADWIERTVQFFADRPDVQLVIRIHPAETWTIGPSVAEIIHKVLPQLPFHIRLIDATEKINTYDLMEITDLALVYTTTAGLEMATRGIPVLVSGFAQYRKKGFTLDADSWEEYFTVLNRALENLPACRLTPAQIAQAWNYAYFYFKEYPYPFPWHIEKIGSGLKKFPITYVLSQEGRNRFEATFQRMADVPDDWKHIQ